MLQHLSTYKPSLSYLPIIQYPSTSHKTNHHKHKIQPHKTQLSPQASRDKTNIAHHINMNKPNNENQPPNAKLIELGRSLSSNAEPIGGILSKYKQRGFLSKPRRSKANTVSQPSHASLNSTGAIPLHKMNELIPKDDPNDEDDPVMSYNPNADDNQSLASSVRQRNSRGLSAQIDANKLSPKLGPTQAHRMSRADSSPNAAPEFIYKGRYVETKTLFF